MAAGTGSPPILDVSIHEVGPRDGLQNESTILAPAVRGELVARLAAAGLRRVEAGSFVSPIRVPAMADAEGVVASAGDLGATTLAGLVLNRRGYERLAQTAIGEVHFSFAATETFNRRNQGVSTAQSLADFAEIVTLAHADGRRVTMTIGASFGCPFEGRVASATILRHAETAVAAGADEVVFADTIGVGVPRQTRELVGGGLSLGVPIGVHLHNSRNTGYVNAWAAVEAGVSSLDASVGGLGGCPFAPQATGNIATEDLVNLLHEEGVGTGVDLSALIETADWLGGVMGKLMPGLVHRAGPFSAPGARELLPAACGAG